MAPKECHHSWSREGVKPQEIVTNRGFPPGVGDSTTPLGTLLLSLRQSEAGGCHCAIPDTNDASKKPVPTVAQQEHSLANVSNLLTVQSPKSTRSRSSHGLLVRATFQFCCFFSSAVFCAKSVVTPTRARARDPLISRGAKKCQEVVPGWHHDGLSGG